MVYFFSDEDKVLTSWQTEIIKDASNLSFYNDKPVLKMLLRDVQVTLRAMIIFDDAYPTSDEFAATSESEFNDQADSYIDHQRKQTNLSIVAWLIRCSSRESPRANSWDANPGECARA